MRQAREPTFMSGRFRPRPRVADLSGGGAAAGGGRDNRELFYLGPDNHVMSVALTMSADGKSVGRAWQRPVKLFPLRPGSTFEPARDGWRFLVNAVVEVSTAGSFIIVVILNWAGPEEVVLPDDLYERHTLHAAG